MIHLLLFMIYETKVDIKGNLLKNCKVHYEKKKNWFHPFIFDTVINDLWKKKSKETYLKTAVFFFFEKKKSFISSFYLWYGVI